MEDREKRVKWIYTSKTNRELEERYDTWAKDYDNDLTDGFGYVAPKKAVDCFVKYVQKDAKILDAGAGTGMVGELLTRQGYKDIVAVDISKGMLEEAKKKNVYREFRQMVLGEHLDFPDDTFDAVISVGVLTYGHAPASSFDELVRITRPGGCIVFSLIPDVYENGGFKEKQESLVKDGKWKLVEVTDKFVPMPKGEPDVFHRDWIYQVV